VAVAIPEVGGNLTVSIAGWDETIAVVLRERMRELLVM
jgi:hypothetical protein